VNACLRYGRIEYVEMSSGVLDRRVGKTSLSRKWPIEGRKRLKIETELRGKTREIKSDPLRTIFVGEGVDVPDKWWWLVWRIGSMGRERVM